MTSKSLKVCFEIESNRQFIILASFKVGIIIDSDGYINFIILWIFINAMKVAVLFSGGKDSTYALYRAIQQGRDVVVLICMKSKNMSSYMFHTPNIDLVKLQARA